MKKLFTLLALIFVCSLTAQEKKSKSKKINLEVSGVCDMCKTRIEKACYSVKGVKSAIWNQEEQQVKLILNERKTSTKIVAEKIASIGHDTGLVTATDEAYNGLHECCKYERGANDKNAKQSCD